MPFADDAVPLPPPAESTDLFPAIPEPKPDKDAIDISEIERKLGLSDVPPALPVRPPQEQTVPPAVLEPAKTESTPPVTTSETNPKDPSAIELPDFTDEDLAALEPKLKPAKPTVKLVTEEPVVPRPANAIAMPHDDLPPIELATGERIDEARLEPAKFLSSDTYFTINADIKAARKILRQNDDAIKEATLRHEQLDQQYKRVASDMHAVQEHLMKIDEALFE